MNALAVCHRRGVSVSSAAPVADEADVNTSLTNGACRDISPVWNALSFRRSFPSAWAEYLRETYKTAYAVQKAFPGIDSKTARDWIGGKRDPSGSFVATVIKRDPAAIQILGRHA